MTSLEDLIIRMDAFLRGNKDSNLPDGLLVFERIFVEP